MFVSKKAGEWVLRGNGCCVGSRVSQNAVAILLSLFGCNPFEIIADITRKYFMWPCLILFSFKVIIMQKKKMSVHSIRKTHCNFVIAFDYCD